MRHPFVKILLSCSLACPSALWAGDQAAGFDVLAVIENGDTIPFELLPIQKVYPTPEAKFASNDRGRKIFWRTIRDVKKTLPYAKQIAAEVHAIDEATMGWSEAKRKDYMKEHEDDLVDKFKPALKKLSLRQGKILIKLVDRQCGQSSYELIKAYRGGFRAAFWQGFAKMLGADLKSGYDKEEEEILEYAIHLVEEGRI